MNQRKMCIAGLGSYDTLNDTLLLLSSPLPRSPGRGRQPRAPTQGKPQVGGSSEGND